MKSNPKNIHFWKVRLEYTNRDGKKRAWTEDKTAGKPWGVKGYTRDGWPIFEPDPSNPEDGVVI